MATKFLEPGGDADFGVLLWPTTGGATPPVVATDFVHGSHLKSLKYAVNSTSYVLGTGFLTTAGSRISIWVYLNALPSATAAIFQAEGTADGSPAVSVMVTSGGVLRLATGDTHTLVGSAGTTLATGVWVRLSLAYTITSTTVNELRLFRGGVLDITASNVTLTVSPTVDLQVGNGDGNSTLDVRSSDHYVDNSTALTDPGNIWVTAKRPNANGTSNQFTTQVGAGGSGYGTGHSPQVNERALSLTNGWSLNSATKVTEEYTVEGAATGDIDISAATIVDYMGWIDAKIASTANTPVTHIIVGGVATTVTMTTASAIYRAVAGSSSYPGGNTDIGMDGQYTTTAHIMTLSECGLVFAYTPAVVAAAPSFGTLQMMGVG